MRKLDFVRIILVICISGIIVTACATPAASTSGPAPGITPTNYPTDTPTSTPTEAPTPEPYHRVIILEDETNMTIVTLEDLKSDSEFVRWEQGQIDKIGPIANDPKRIDYFYAPLTNNLNILDHHLQGDIGSGVQSTEFFSYYKIYLGPWGYPDKAAYVVMYAYEDASGEKTPVHFFVTGKQARDLLDRDGGLNKNIRGKRLVPTSIVKPGPAIALIDGEPGGPDDLRSIANIFYNNQGYTQADIVSLFQRIADSDTIAGEDKKMFESILFWAGPLTVNDVELK